MDDVQEVEVLTKLNELVISDIRSKQASVWGL